MSSLNLILFAALYLYGALLLYLTLISKKKGDMGAFYNNLINSLFYIGSLTISIFNIYFLKITTTTFIIFPFDMLIMGFIIIYLPLLLLIINREKKKYQDESWRKYYITSLDKLPLKYEIYRKLTHLVVLGIIFFYFTLGFLVQHFFIYIFRLAPPFISDLFFSLYNLEGDKMIFTQYLVVFLVSISLIGLISVDAIRILKPGWYPLKPVNLILREKERTSRIGPHISMGIGCFSVIISLGIFQPIGPLIICTSMTMAIFGDMTANLVGRTIGRKKIRKTNKTFEGLISGMLSSYLTGLLCLILLNAIYHISTLGIFLLPLLGTLIIGMMDYINLDIDDNLLFITLVSIFLFIVSPFLIY